MTIKDPFDLISATLQPVDGTEILPAWHPATANPIALSSQTLITAVGDLIDQDFATQNARITASEGDIAVLETEMNTAQADIDTVEARVTQTEADIANIVANSADEVYAEAVNLPVETVAADIAHVLVVDTSSAAEKATPLLVATAQIAATATTAPAGGDLFLGASSGIPRKWTAAQTAGVVYGEANSLGTGTALARVLGVTGAGAAAGRENAAFVTDLLGTAGVPGALGAGVTYLPSGTGADERTIQSKLRETVSVSDFGAIGNGSDETAKIAEAIAAVATNGGTVVFPPTASYYGFTTLSISANNVTLHVPQGAELRQLDIDVHGIVVSGDFCSIEGRGVLSCNVASLSDYATTGSGIDRSIVHVTGDDFLADGIAINTPSRCGIFVDNGDRAEIRNCRGDGGYLLADYTAGTTINLYAVYVDPPENGFYHVHNCDFKRFICPVASGNLVGTGGSLGAQINHNHFHECYDHAAYLLNCQETTVSFNVCVDVRKPFVIDGASSQIKTNTCIATGTSATNHEIGFSIRDTDGAIIENNHLEGVGAYIDISSLNSAELINSRVSGNTLIATAESSELAASIRLSSTTNISNNNSIDGNRIVNVSDYNASQGAITIGGNATYIGTNNAVENNRVTLSGAIVGFICNYSDIILHKGNIYDRSGYSAASAETLQFLYVANSDGLRSEDNEYKYLTGGTNVTSQAVYVDASCSGAFIKGERNRQTSGSLVATSLIAASGTDGFKTRNVYDQSAPLSGTVTLASGVTLGDYNNGNVAFQSRIQITPANAGACQQQSNYSAHQGVYANNDFSNGRFLLVTGDGNVTAVSGVWYYEIDG